MKPQYLVSMHRWTAPAITDLRRFSEQTGGIILGDPFCPQRMFEHGDWDIVALAALAKGAGLYVAFQTPVYLTPRNFTDVFNLIRLLEEKDLLDLLFVQDLGLLNLLKEAGSSIPPCWSFWGGGRGDLVSRDLLDFLMGLNVQYWETNKPTRVAPLQEYGLKVVYRRYAPPIATFGRFCYTQYITGKVCVEGTLCQHEEFELVATDGKLRLKADGYTLTYPQSFFNPIPATSPDYISIHVDELARLSQVINDGTR